MPIQNFLGNEMKHVLFTLYDCDEYLLDDEEFIRIILGEATKKMGATHLNTVTHKFQPQGVTAVTLLAESHMSIHTWPEKKMAVCDVFTCGEHTVPRAGVTYMYEMMDARDIVSNEFVRPLE